MDSVQKSNSPDNLIAGKFPIVEDGITVLTTQDLTRGTILALNGDSKAVPCDKDAADGTEDPYGILAEDTDTTGGDKVAPVYLTGEFFGDEIEGVAGSTGTALKSALRAISIYVK